MTITIHEGDCREVLGRLPAESVQCVVTSPPYLGLRDYGVAGQIGLERSPAAYVGQLVEVFRQVRRVLRRDGTLWLNLGDSYNDTGRRKPNARPDGTLSFRAGCPGLRIRGLKPKDLIGIPWRVALALQDDGWWLRSDIIWHKPNPMPESARDRPTKAHEYLFLLTKSARYFYDAEAIAERAETAEEARWDPGADGLAGDHRRTGRSTRRFRKVPAGWDQGPGSHGSIHRAGRNRGVPPKHAPYESSNRSGLDDVPRGGVRNARSVWTIATQPFSEAHFATFPPELAHRCILAATRPGDTVIDPFAGAGTTLLVADREQRHGIGIELSPDYAALIRRRVLGDAPLLAEIAA